jgi:hypothetical protein
MLPLSRRLWVSFCAVDAAVFVTVYGFFAGIDSIGFVRAVLPFLVLVRTGVLLTLIRRATASPTHTPAPTVAPRTARLGEGHAVGQSGSRL